MTPAGRRSWRCWSTRPACTGGSSTGSAAGTNIAGLLGLRGEGRPQALHVRAWRCQTCGAWLDRDVNAAVTVAKAAGLAVTACGAQVSPGAMLLAPRSEAGTLPKPRRQAA